MMNTVLLSALNLPATQLYDKWARSKPSVVEAYREWIKSFNLAERSLCRCDPDYVLSIYVLWARTSLDDRADRRQMRVHTYVSVMFDLLSFALSASLATANPTAGAHVRPLRRKRKGQKERRQGLIDLVTTDPYNRKVSHR